MVEVMFANPKYKIADYYKYLHEAVCHANIFLIRKHGLYCTIPKSIECNPYKCFLKIKSLINNEETEVVNIGNHLRGVSKFLFDKYPEIFKKMKVGERLLFCNTVNAEEIYAIYQLLKEEQFPEDICYKKYENNEEVKI